ncbi:MAG: hypothetical protein LBG48_03655, partial [Rickettsiales bacterium]|nr:hypothetical protein [Rickettsiales bacterium]
ASLDTIQPTGALNIYLSAFIKTRMWVVFMAAKQEILLNIIRIVMETGGELANTVPFISLDRQQ